MEEFDYVLRLYGAGTESVIEFDIGKTNFDWLNNWAILGIPPKPTFFTEVSFVMPHGGRLVVDFKKFPIYHMVKKIHPISGY